MQFHRGRLVDHVHLRVADVDASKRFYKAVFAALGLPDVLVEGAGYFHADELFVDQATDYVTRVHLAFQASSPAIVQPSMQPRSPQAAATTARRASAPTTRATMAPSSSTRTATTSRPSITARPSDPRPRWC